MAARKNICSVPDCGEEINNKKHGLCRKCASSMYYWNRRRKENPKALQLRLAKLKFWGGRLDWLYK